MSAATMAPINPVAPAGKMRSVQAMRAVATVTGIKPRERNVLYVLAEFAGEGENGLECFPSINTIAAKADICPRQVKRVIRRLRDKRIITFEDNAGGKGKSNRYLLLFANGDTSNGDIQNGDKRNSDIVNANGDKSSTRTVTFSQQTVTKRTPNGDQAMSPEGVEWYEGKNEWKQQWENLPSNYSFDGDSLFQNQVSNHYSDPSKFRHYYHSVMQEVEAFEKNPEDLLRQILKGYPVQKHQECDCKGHGSFIRRGYQFGNWIAWAGHESCYSSAWTSDAGCPGCRAEHEENWKDEPAAKRERFMQTLPVRQFELRTPANCPDHGYFIFEAELTEYSEWYEKHGSKRFRVEMDYMCGCPGCDADHLYEEDIRDRLLLSWKEWERGGKEIMAAIAYAEEAKEKATA